METIRFEFEGDTINYDFSDVQLDNILKAVAVIIIETMNRSGITASELMDTVSKDYLPKMFINIMFAERSDNH